MIGNIIKYMRKSKNFTQSELANILNIGRSTLSDYEREKTDINFELIYKLCQKCDFEIIFKSKFSNEEITVENIKRKI